MDNIQKVSSYITVQSSQTFEPYCIAYKTLASQKLDIPEYLHLKTFAI
jgi:hypothetical protein